MSQSDDAMQLTVVCIYWGNRHSRFIYFCTYIFMEPPFDDKSRFQLEVEKRRGHFALNYLPYNPVGTLLQLDVQDSRYSLPELAHLGGHNLKAIKDGSNQLPHSHTNQFSRHSRSIHPENSQKGKNNESSYTGGFSNIVMELKTGEERLKLSRMGKPYHEILLEEDEFEKLLAIPNSISFQNIHTYLKKCKLSNFQSDNSPITQPPPRPQINKKLVISERFRPMLFLCRILANMKGNSSVTTGCQEKCVTKIYTIHLLLNGIYNVRVRDLKSKFPLAKLKLKEIYKDLDTAHRHYSHHNIHSSYNHYHHHYTSKANTQQKAHVNPLLIEQTEHLSSHNLTRRRGLSINPMCSVIYQEMEELAMCTPLWQKLLQHPYIEREDHIRKKSLWDINAVRNIKQEWCDKFGQINYLNAKDVQVDLAEWRKETKPRIGYKLKYLDSNQTFMKSINQMRDSTVYALEEEALKKGKGYPVWLQNLETEAKESGVSGKVNIVLSKMKDTYGAEDIKSVPHAKEKLCLLFFSMPSTEVTIVPVMEAFKFILKSILHSNPDCFPHWMQYRDVPLPHDTK